MGDDNIEGGLLWADEDLDGTAIYQNPDLVDDGSDDDGDVSDDDDADRLESTNLIVAAEKKSLKRKEKFEKLKKVKKSKHDESETESKEACALSAASMAELIRSSEPIASINASTDDLKLSLIESNFFDPSKSLHAQAKSSCIFVNSIAASIPAFRKALGAETKSSDENGSPIVLVVCASAHRSTDIINSMSNGLKCKIAKLFAKHFKVQDQVDLLSKQYFPVAVGTPNRLSKLVELGALSLSRVKVLLIDMAEDEKKFSILTMPLVKEDFYSFLLKCIQPECGHVKISLVSGKIHEAKTAGNDLKTADDGDTDSTMNRRKGKSRFNKGKFSAKRKGF